MPIEITKEQDYIFTRAFGVVTAADLLAAADKAAAVEAEASMPNRLSDLTSVEDFDFDFTAVSALADRRRAVRHAVPLRSAIIAIKPVAIGFARMFQTLNDNPLVEMRIVSSRAEAEAWFAEAEAETGA